MTARTAEPLPECSLCEMPTKREVHAINGGLCSACTRGVADTVRMLMPGPTGVIDIDELRRRRLLQRSTAVHDDPTVFIERYTPPVPGQQELDL